MSDTATMEFSAKTKKMGDEIADLNLKEAKEVSDYLKQVYGIEPAAGGAVMMLPVAVQLRLPPWKRPSSMWS